MKTECTHAGNIPLHLFDARGESAQTGVRAQCDSRVFECQPWRWHVEHERIEVACV
jgi:hypothetical protein